MLNHQLNRKHCPKCRPPQRFTQRGFTLLELLVCVLILGVIIIPLSSALIMSLRVTGQVDSQLNASNARQTLESYFTGDVASVDAAGVSTAGGDFACYAPTTHNPTNDSLLVTFNSTVLDQTLNRAVTKRVSYWRSGLGKSMSLLRMVCPDVNFPTANAGRVGTKIVVASNVGTKTSVQASTIKGDVPPSKGPVNPAVPPVCTEFVCAVKIEGAFSYSVSAQRRVFGAAVPLEVGKLYSSNPDIQYQLYGRDGLPTVKEFKWGGKLSLAPGLEDNTVIKVEFAVQRQTTKCYMTTLSGGGVGFATAPDSGCTNLNETWLPGTYDTALRNWKLDLPVDRFNAGGEYKVWTRITPLETNVPKKNGGASGFKLWIDWKPEDSVFVSIAGYAATTQTGTVYNNPMRDIQQALRKAAELGRTTVLVAHEGPSLGPGGLPLTYPPLTISPSTVLTAGTRLMNGNFTIVGGLDYGTWLRKPPTATAGSPVRNIGRSKIVGLASGSISGTGVLVDGTPAAGPKPFDGWIRFRQMSVDSGPTPPVPAYPALSTPTTGSSYGMKVITGAEVFLEQSFVKSADGIDGIAGTTPVTSGKNHTAVNLQACWGQNGQAADTSDQVQYFTSPLGAADACVNSTNRLGGRGGAGGSWNILGAGGSNNGRGPGDTGTGGLGGSSGCFGIGQGAGGNGPGTAGGAGGVGGGSWNNAAVTASGIVRNDGRPGTDGQPGMGGYGAGGGGANVCVFASGQSGGQGGQGGIAGVGGTGGRAGGNSIGIFVFNAKVTVLEQTFVAAGRAGNAGRGGNGGWGGNGGVGGNGATNWVGSDGSGGSGDAGIAAAIYSNGTVTTGSGSTVVKSANSTLTAGAAGTTALTILGKAGGGGAGGDGTNRSILWGLINWSTPTGVTGGQGTDATAAYQSLPGASCSNGAYNGTTCVAL